MNRTVMILGAIVVAAVAVVAVVFLMGSDKQDATVEGTWYSNDYEGYDEGNVRVVGDEFSIVSIVVEEEIDGRLYLSVDGLSTVGTFDGRFIKFSVVTDTSTAYFMGRVSDACDSALFSVFIGNDRGTSAYYVGFAKEGAAHMTPAPVAIDQQTWTQSLYVKNYLNGEHVVVTDEAYSFVFTESGDNIFLADMVKDSGTNHGKLVLTAVPDGSITGCIIYNSSSGDLSFKRVSITDSRMVLADAWVDCDITDHPHISKRVFGTLNSDSIAIEGTTWAGHYNLKGFDGEVLLDADMTFEFTTGTHGSVIGRSSIGTAYDGDVFDFIGEFTPIFNGNYAVVLAGFGNGISTSYNGTYDPDTGVISLYGYGYTNGVKSGVACVTLTQTSSIIGTWYLSSQASSDGITISDIATYSEADARDVLVVSDVEYDMFTGTYNGAAVSGSFNGGTLKFGSQGGTEFTLFEARVYGDSMLATVVLSAHAGTSISRSTYLQSGGSGVEADWRDFGPYDRAYNGQSSYTYDTQGNVTQVESPTVTIVSQSNNIVIWQFDYADSHYTVPTVMWNTGREGMSIGIGNPQTSSGSLTMNITTFEGMLYTYSTVSNGADIVATVNQCIAEVDGLADPEYPDMSGKAFRGTVYVRDTGSSTDLTPVDMTFTDGHDGIFIAETSVEGKDVSFLVKLSEIRKSYMASAIGITEDGTTIRMAGIYDPLSDRLTFTGTGGSGVTISFSLKAA